MSFVFGVLGYPLKHSLSPNMFNAAFGAANIDASYKKFEVKERDLKEFFKKIKAGRWAKFAGLAGLSVTIPYKETVMEYLDFADETVKAIGACNTIKIAGGKLHGFNTDYLGILKAFEEANVDLQDKKVALIGAGGAASAALYAFLNAGSVVKIFNRTAEKDHKLANRLIVSAKNADLSSYKNHNQDCVECVDTTEFDKFDADIIFNATPVGMFPNTEAMPVPKDYIKPNMVIFDAVYNPRETMLIKCALQVGAIVIYGHRMLLNQAIEQYKIWFGAMPNVMEMENALGKAV